MMKIREAKWEVCRECGSKKHLIQEESYGCDQCKKPIDDLLNSDNRKYADYLQITVFYNCGREAEHFQFCSWKCVFKFLKKIKTDYFVSLPYLTYEKTIKGQTVKDFFKHITIPRPKSRRE